MALTQKTPKDMFHTVEDILEPTPARERFREHFLTPVETHNQRWCDLWDGGEFLPWDKGASSPALVDLLANKTSYPFFLANEDKYTAKSPKIALVPGCGRGYDVLLLAQHGYHAVGVDVSKKAITEAEDWIIAELERLEGAGLPVPTGRISLVIGDFFNDDWAKSLGLIIGGTIDLIYDYAFLVALHPALRTKVAARMAQLLSKGAGQLIALEYPLFRPAETGGPPHGITSEVYDDLFGEKFEKVVHYSPARTHKVGEGSDMVSIWRRRDEN